MHKRRVGRPSIFTPELGASICERIALGESLRAICREEGMPAQRTVLEWLSQDEEFRAKYVRAREDQGDTMDDRILEVADRVESGEMAPDAARVVLGALQWRAAKLRPKVYGERTTHEVEGAIKHYVVEVPPVVDQGEWLKTFTSSGDHGPDHK